MDRHALVCPCSCHGRPNHPCDWDGGCGNLHVDTVLVRPTSACVLCPPSKTQAWRLADPSYKTCTGCYDRLRSLLKEIPERFLLLDARPNRGSDHGSRGAPGFGSRAPASEHIIAMRDRRSSAVARTWLGRDGRLHQESERPPLSVHNVLDLIAWDIAEQRGIDGPATALDVADLTRWIDAQLDWATRNDLIVDIHQMLRDLVNQLRSVTGEPGRKHIGICPSGIVEDEITSPCGAKLYPPARGDTIVCNACGQEWHRPDWEHLGRVLQQQTLQQAS